jgi:hypothetical protein
VGSFSWFTKRSHDALTRPAERLNEYFLAAVFAHVLHGDENARAAAFAAGIMTSDLQRSGLVAFLERLAAEVRLSPNMDGWGDSSQRELASVKLNGLAKQLAGQRWDLGTSITLQRHLAKLEPEYAKALRKQEARVFLDRYPDLPSSVIFNSKP